MTTTTYEDGTITEELGPYEIHVFHDEFAEDPRDWAIVNTEIWTQSEGSPTLPAGSVVFTLEQSYSGAYTVKTGPLSVEEYTSQLCAALGYDSAEKVAEAGYAGYYFAIDEETRDLSIYMKVLHSDLGCDFGPDGFAWATPEALVGPYTYGATPEEMVRADIAHFSAYETGEVYRYSVWLDCDVVDECGAWTDPAEALAEARGYVANAWADANDARLFSLELDSA